MSLKSYVLSTRGSIEHGHRVKTVYNKVNNKKGKQASNLNLITVTYNISRVK